MARRRHRRGRVVVLGLILLAVAAATLYFGRRAPDDPSPPEPSVAPAIPAPTDGAPAAGEAERDTRAGAVEGAPAGRIALVIDDLGRSLALVERLVALGIPVTGAVLPYEPHSSAVAGSLGRHGLEVLCHLPMEPAPAGPDPGPGALTLAMSPDQVREATRRALDAVPHAIGANNHMGSAFSADPAAMRTVLEEVGDRHLLYLDSRTGADSVGFRLAAALGVASAERDVFLDGVTDGPVIAERWRELLEESRVSGAAIAIGHPHESTLAFLEGAVPEALARGFEFVPVSYLVDRPGLPPI